MIVVKTSPLTCLTNCERLSGLFFHQHRDVPTNWLKTAICNKSMGHWAGVEVDEAMPYWLDNAILNPLFLLGKPNLRLFGDGLNHNGNPTVIVQDDECFDMAVHVLACNGERPQRCVWSPVHAFQGSWLLLGLEVSFPGKNIPTNHQPAIIDRLYPSYIYRFWWLKPYK